MVKMDIESLISKPESLAAYHCHVINVYHLKEYGVLIKKLIVWFFQFSK